jgi:hypothetical protein
MTGVLTRELTRNIGFVAFDSIGTAPHQLDFFLADQDASGSSPGAVVFKARLTTPWRVHPSRLWHPFRGTGEVGHAIAPTAQALVAELQPRVPRNAERYQFLVHEFLKHVPIAENTAMVRSPSQEGWILPYLHRELCISENSRFFIENILTNGNEERLVPVAADAYSRLNSPVGTARAQSIIAKLIAPGADLLQGLRTGRVRPRAAYVTDYQQHQQCSQPRHQHRPSH